jgi:hypothetical protein
MFTRTIVRCLALIALSSLSSSAQQNPAASIPPSVLQFPVVLQQGLETGKTAVGSKVEARLAVATLVNGIVFPQNAIFSGVVIDSIAKTKKNPSRLAIRMDSVHWKDGSASIKAYLTGWYYPTASQAGQNLQYGPPEPASKTWNGAGQYPNADSRVYQPFPGSDSGKDAGAIPDTPSSTTSNRPSQMKDVALAPTDGGGIALVSEHGNLKLDRLTTYVLAATPQAPK